ncbi:hypothetical protein TRIUR3_11804 [Triticum urartu]|uniref:Uncharacterized protein n=1 Tax=Triticum urartu TaxID=4572 RepID=M8A2Y7_TRIUA|nr:hypothetical protein TRIUR3_11804 [Triticum urartu]
MVRNTRERLEADFSKLDTKIHRFPRGLRPGINERYVTPSFVSLGPYHHGSPHLRETEELKHVAAHYFCEMSGHSVAHVYDKILHIAGEARSCYADGAVANFTNAEFARRSQSYTSLSLASTSAIELAEIGIKLTASKKKGLANMSIQRDYCLFGGQLSLTPLFINDFTACWLVNMAAYEACVSTRYPSDGFVVSSYISLLAMLMDREEDVHQLRAKHLVRSLLGNHELLVFFKGLACHLRLGRRYFIITGKIDRFKRRRPVSIAVHRNLQNLDESQAASALAVRGVPSDFINETIKITASSAGLGFRSTYKLLNPTAAKKLKDSGDMTEHNPQTKGQSPTVKRQQTRKAQVAEEASRQRRSASCQRHCEGEEKITRRCFFLQLSSLCTLVSTLRRSIYFACYQLDYSCPQHQ